MDQLPFAVQILAVMIGIAAIIAACKNGRSLQKRPLQEPAPQASLPKPRARRERTPSCSRKSRKG
jgi:hypothetical protein